MIKKKFDKIIRDYKNTKNKPDFLFKTSKTIFLISLDYLLFTLGRISFLISDKNNYKNYCEEHKRSKNSPVFTLNNRKKILIGLAAIAFSLGLLGYIISDKTNGILDILNSTIALFFGEFKDDNNTLLDLAKLLAIICVSFGAISLFFSNKINDWIVKNVQKKPYQLVIGLSRQNRHYIDSIMKKSENHKEDSDNKPEHDTNEESSKSIDTTLIIEADENHEANDHYRQKGFGVISSKAEEAIDRLHLDKLKRCVISTGNDRQNIALALRLVDKIPPPSEEKRGIYVRIDNRDLSVLFQENVNIVSNQVEKGIDVIPHSLQTIICRQLFKDHSILGQYSELVENGDPFNIVLVGASKLATEIIYHLAILAHLPGQNHLTIYVIDEEATRFCENVKKRFTGITKIPQLTLTPLELNSDSLSFYEDPVWQSSNLTNIIIATENDDKNLDIAVNLQDTTYIQETTNAGQFRTNVLFAIYSHAGLGEKIDEIQNAFANFYTFADLSIASSEGNLIDEDLELIAGLIHYHGYKDHPLSKEKKVNKGAVNDAWMKIPLNEKESNRSQALHIDIKLMSLGLEKVRSSTPIKNLFETNQAIFNHKLASSSTEESLLQDRIFVTPLDKLARAEHNRWNAFHYLRGWQYHDEMVKKSKLHKCLLPLEDFSDELFQDKYKYDVFSVQNIPLYLAHAGYEIDVIEQKNKLFR